MFLLFLGAGSKLTIGWYSTNVGTIGTEQGVHGTSNSVINWSWCGCGGDDFGETATIWSIAAAWVTFHNGMVLGTIIERVDGRCLGLAI